MSDRMHVATRKGLLTFVRNSGSWKIHQRSFLGDPVSNVLEDARDGTLYAALDLGHFGAKLRRSTDGGETWEEVGVPGFPKDPEEEATQESKGKAPSLKQIWSLETGGPDQPGLLWAGCIPAGLFRSENRGESWELVTAMWDRPERHGWFGGGTDAPGLHSILVDPRDSAKITIGISVGGVWHSNDMGETWNLHAKGMRAAYMPPENAYDQNIQDPHRLVRCLAQPDTLWCQHHNGVFKSTDNGANWQEITTTQPSNFGFAVVVHPTDPDHAWLVPGVKDECRMPVDSKLVVSHTRDGGNSWQLYDNGLPQEQAYDIVYRHAFDIDSAGETLAMGSTTGNLWVSDNQGKEWTSISSTLPPIYAIRFVK